MINYVEIRVIRDNTIKSSAKVEESDIIMMHEIHDIDVLFNEYQKLINEINK
jgi:hypothetical protein